MPALSREVSSTVSNALEVLDQFLHTPQLRFSELARHTHLSRAALARILNTMVAQGFLRRDAETGFYSCSAKVLSLAAATAQSFVVGNRARPVMQNIAREVAETVSLIVPVDLHGVCIEQVSPERELRYVDTLGRPVPLHAGASRKVLIAFLSDEVVERVLSNPLDQVTERTVTSARLLRRQLAQIRKRGYAISRGEHIDGVSAIAVPVWGLSGAIAASLSIAGPSIRLSDQILREKCLPQLLEGAARIGYPQQSTMGGEIAASAGGGRSATVVRPHRAAGHAVTGRRGVSRQRRV